MSAGGPPPDWPNAAASRMVEVAPHRWHVQVSGSGPDLLLLHGAGASAHSFRDLLPDLARDHRAIAPDLPGQGFTRLGTRSRSGLAPMAADLADLLAALGATPRLLVGHSAGAALALRLALDLRPPPAAVVAINGALAPFRGVAGWLFPVLAKLLALNPLTAIAFARLAAAPGSVRNLIESTGSRIDARGLDCYRALVTSSRHVDATLAMMAQWDLAPLLAELPRLDLPVLLLAGAGDRAVPPETSEAAARALPRAEVEIWRGAGHLLHEERPAETAARIRAFAAGAGA